MTTRPSSQRAKRRLLDLCGAEGGATLGYQRAGWHVIRRLGADPMDPEVREMVREELVAIEGGQAA